MSRDKYRGNTAQVWREMLVQRINELSGYDADDAPDNTPTAAMFWQAQGEIAEARRWVSGLHRSQKSQGWRAPSFHSYTLSVFSMSKNLSLVDIQKKPEEVVTLAKEIEHAEEEE